MAAIVQGLIHAYVSSVLLSFATCRQPDGGTIAGNDRLPLREVDEILNTHSGIFMQSTAEGLSERIRRCMTAGNS